MRLLIPMAIVALVGVGIWLGRRAMLRRASNQVEWIDRSRLLYSCPSIHDGLPAVSDIIAPTADVGIVLHEDEWRQVELVSSENRTALQASLAELDAFKRANRVGVGYKSVHLRQDLPTSLAGRNISVEQLLAISHASERGPLYIDWLGGPRRVQSGFSLRLHCGTVVYGEAEGGSVRTLGLLSTSLTPDTALAETLRTLGTLGLSLVDWQAGIQVQIAEESSTMEWLRWSASE